MGRRRYKVIADWRSPLGDDETWDEEPCPITQISVYEPDEQYEFSGLYDRFGCKLYAYIGLNPIGFLTDINEEDDE